MTDRIENFELESGARYTVDWDDGAIKMITGKYLEPEVLPLLMEYALKNIRQDNKVLVNKFSKK